MTRIAGIAALIGIIGLASAGIAGCASSDGKNAARPPNDERRPNAIGGVVGKALGDVGLEVDVDNFAGEDRKRHAQASHRAFLAEPVGGQRSWSNPATGSHGTTTITGRFRNADRVPCKHFTRNTILNGKTYITDGAACEQLDGTWRIVDLRPRNEGQPVSTD